MPTVTCKYFVNVLGATKKDGETVDIEEGMTVERFLDYMTEKYGDGFGKHVYATGTLDGETYRTPNIYLNKKRIQWVQDFPKGLQTIVRDGDEFWFGLIVGGGGMNAGHRPATAVRTGVFEQYATAVPAQACCPQPGHKYR